VGQEAEATGAAGWRRRYPVLARGILYGAGALLIALAVLLLLERGKVDHQDRLDYLEARLGSLDVLAVNDPTGDQVEKVLDEVFAERNLPARLRQRALRARAFLHLRRDEADAALADLDAAAALIVEPLERAALGLERVQILLVADRGPEAEAALEALTLPAHPVLAIWRGILRAQLLDGQDRPAEAARVLDQALEALERPLPATEPLFVCQTPWTPADAAIHATKALAELRGGGRADPRPWQRLLGLAPRDLTAALEAAKALAQGGHGDEAARAWAWAVSLNDGLAPENAASDPDLAALEKKRVEGLKARGGAGR